jgi:hypothetical protein
MANSTPFADDGFRKRLTLDGDRLIVRVVVVDVKGWVGQAGDKASRHQSLINMAGGVRQAANTDELRAWVHMNQIVGQSVDSAQVKPPITGPEKAAGAVWGVGSEPPSIKRPSTLLGTVWLGVHGRVIHGQPFGSGGEVQLLVGGNEG